MQEFSSKIDTWLLLVLLLTIAVSVIGGALLIKRRGGLIGYGAGIILIAICGIFPAWLLVETHYTVSSGFLIIKSGPRMWEISTSSISFVEQTRDSRSSPALSLDRLKIHYGEGNTVMVSPEDKRGFLNAIDYSGK